MFPNKFAIFASILGVNRIHTINDSSLGINGVGDGNQCGIYFFPQGLSGVAYYPMTVIVNRYCAYTSFANNQGEVARIEWIYDGNKWIQL
jgi:hypothetical protein